MQVWAIGIVCLYVALGVFNWVTGLHWLAEFSLPMSIVAGLGLAIAASPSFAPLPKSSDTTASIDSDEPATETEATPPQTPRQTSTQLAEPSISFTINKDVRPS